MPQYEMRYLISLAIQPHPISDTHLLSWMLSEFQSALRDNCVYAANPLRSITPSSPLL